MTRTGSNLDQRLERIRQMRDLVVAASGLALEPCPVGHQPFTVSSQENPYTHVVAFVFAEPATGTKYRWDPTEGFVNWATRTLKIDFPVLVSCDESVAKMLGNAAPDPNLFRRVLPGDFAAPPHCCAPLLQILELTAARLTSLFPEPRSSYPLLVNVGEWRVLVCDRPSARLEVHGKGRLWVLPTHTPPEIIMGREQTRVINLHANRL